ncbi:hypothetical protein GCM10011491_41330 [Brucella endophytica]|uniref:Uncharacterized protein n=1 Tax=Brucella endophytica TaxID=1963359 RepID=A0A916SQU6_9HYPH|nr:hypothetical protein [Brucella endophytica]GGB09115.1 hypothetical protein GCM10011491_41330 [Brucella endophytica]
MKRSTCKRCGGSFWESHAGAHDEDLCDNCEGKRATERGRTIMNDDQLKALKGAIGELKGELKTFDQRLNEITDEGMKTLRRAKSEAKALAFGPRPH